MTTPARPQKVTLACLVAGMGSVLVLVTVFAELSNWGSLEVRKQVQDALGSTPFVGSGADVDTALRWLRVGLMVVAAGSAAGVVAAVWTAKGHRGARGVLTTLGAAAGAMFLVTGLAGLLPAAMALWCLAYLWSKESRAWFAGEDPPAARNRPPASPSDGAASAARDAPPAGGSDARPQVVHSPSDGPPPSDRPFGTPVSGQPPQGQPPYGQPPQGPGSQGPRSQPHPTPWPSRQGVRRPRSIVVAVVVTSVMAGLVGLVCGANAMLYLLSPSEYTQLLVEQPMLRESGVLDELGLSASELSRLVFIGATVCAVLAIAAVGTALLMLRRLPAARIGLTVLTGLAIALSVVAFPFGLLWAVGEVFVLVQLYRVDANAWFAAHH